MCNPEQKQKQNNNNNNSTGHCSDANNKYSNSHNNNINRNSWNWSYLATCPARGQRQQGVLWCQRSELGKEKGEEEGGLQAGIDHKCLWNYN